MASTGSRALQPRRVSSALSRPIISAGTMTWQMPGRNTTGRLCIAPYTGSERDSIRSGRGMATVPMKQPSIWVI